MMVIRVISSPSPIAWWNQMVGQVSQVLDIYPPTGYMKVRLTRRCTYSERQEEEQIEGWIDPRFVEVMGQMAEFAYWIDYKDKDGDENCRSGHIKADSRERALEIFEALKGEHGANSIIDAGLSVNEVEPWGVL